MIVPLHELQEKYGTSILAPGSRSTRAYLAAVTEMATPTEGIYYCVQGPSGAWELVTCRFDEVSGTSDVTHDEYWSDFVAQLVASKWAKVLKVDQDALAYELTLHCYGFPRGRISRFGNKYMVHHGGDTPPAITKELVRRGFSLPLDTKWEFDSHERCTVNDLDALKDLLKLNPTWNAVSAEDTE